MEARAGITETPGLVGRVTSRIAGICGGVLDSCEVVCKTKRSGRPENGFDWGEGHTLLYGIKAARSGGCAVGYLRGLYGVFCFVDLSILSRMISCSCETSVRDFSVCTKSGRNHQDKMGIAECVVIDS